MVARLWSVSTPDRMPFHPRQLPSGILSLTLAVVSWMLALCAGAAAVTGQDRPAPDPEAGRAAYLQHCARCHGAAGQGDGLDAKRFYPRPRDLTLGVYKFRSTASGTPPTDEDLFRTITQGLPGTNMPDWKHLNDATRWRLVDYLKSLAPTFADTEPSPVTLERDPGPQRADLAKGKAVYEQLGCAACHGAAGRANGTSAAGLVDDWGLPIRPADLTHGWAYRGGQQPQDILMRLWTGIDGAGMPSYAEAVSPSDAWQLAYYVASLQEPPHWNLIAHALVVAGDLPTAADDPRWASAERTDVRVRNVVTPEGEWRHPPTVRAVSFKAIANDEAVALLISWHDPTQDAQAPADRLALVLKPAGLAGDVVSLQAWPSRGAPPLDLCHWSAATGQAREQVVPAFERLEPASGAPLASRATYDDGAWQLVVQRPLEQAQVGEAGAIAKDGLTAIAFAVWDGGNPEARAVSPWVDLSIRRRGRDTSIFPQSIDLPAGRQENRTVP